MATPSTVIHFFLSLRDNLKLLHWSTHLYAQHMATDQILEQLDSSIDHYVEIMLGKLQKRPKLTGDNAVIRLQNITEAGASRMVRSAIQYLQGPLSRSLREGDADLANIRDEMVGQLNQLLYLFSLH